MAQRRITAVGNSAALLLPPDVLQQLGLQVGDEVDLSIVEHKLIVRSLDEAERAQRINEVTQDVLQRRQAVYRELAKGVDEG